MRLQFSLPRSVTLIAATAEGLPADGAATVRLRRDETFASVLHPQTSLTVVGVRFEGSARNTTAFWTAGQLTLRLCEMAALERGVVQAPNAPPLVLADCAFLRLDTALTGATGFDELSAQITRSSFLRSYTADIVRPGVVTIDSSRFSSSNLALVSFRCAHDNPAQLRLLNSSFAATAIDLCVRSLAVVNCSFDGLRPPVPTLDTAALKIVNAFGIEVPDALTEASMTFDGSLFRRGVYVRVRASHGALFGVVLRVSSLQVPFWRRSGAPRAQRTADLPPLPLREQLGHRPARSRALRERRVWGRHSRR